jgi:hypothetical protein
MSECLSYFKPEYITGKITQDSFTKDGEKMLSKGQTVVITGLKKHLISLGLIGASSLNKRIPESYLYSSVEDRISLLQGLMDTDGSCDQSRPERVKYSTSSPTLKEDVIVLLRGLGLKPKVSEASPKSNWNATTGKEIHTKHVNYSILFTVPEYLGFKPFRLSGKLKNWAPSTTDRLNNLYVKNITKIEDKEVRCIEVSNPSHLYLTGEANTVTHNCTGRNAPKAKFFPFAQSAWQRSMVKVPQGMKLVAFDFSGEEIFVGAAFHKDENMMKAYLSKDYYLYAGAMMGVIPKGEFDKLPIGELKVKYSKERKLLKGLILGLGYLMGVAKLAANLFPDESEYRGKSIATRLSKQYRSAFSQFFKSGEQFVKDNKVPRMLHHWGHVGLEKGTTANNFPIQGSSAEILHLAMIALSNRAHWKKGIYVFSPLHDAIYVFIKDDEQFESNVKYVANKMQEATAHVLNYYDHRIKVGYQICNHGQTFVEKNEDDVIKIFNLLGRDYVRMNHEEYIIE